MGIWRDGTRCACRRRDPYECWSTRYCIPAYEESGDESFDEQDGGPCECHCHEEAAYEDDDAAS